MAVAALVGEHGGTEEEVIAALLHDCVEDGDGLDTLDEIRSEFGPDIADIVWGCTDAHEQPKPPWRARKESFIATLKSASSSVKQVVAADKIHNAQSLHTLLLDRGANAWDDFAGKREGTLWYYRAIAEALATNWESSLLNVLNREIDRLNRAADGT
jgi:GTP pyrophosphokinase